ncbi:MAG: winged helix-turn-helix domain-containing protein, partial [Actinobacteria bacterium]|nr:winged helix-turn-helix domain-containing protein [Actinomycetota bacterium]
MEFGILGPLEISHDGRPLRIGAAKERALIVRLLLEPGRVVAIDRLVDDLWEGEPPDSANVSVRVHVSRIRKSMEAARAPKVIVTDHPGYRIAVAADTLDVGRFERLVERGRAELSAGDASSASATFGEALALWRGAALADVVGYDFARAETARLEESRLAATEDKIEAD